MKKFIAFTLLYWAASMAMLLFVDRPMSVVVGFTAVYVIIGLYELAKLYPLCHDHGSDEQDEGNFPIGFEAGGYLSDARSWENEVPAVVMPPQARPLPTPWSENGVTDEAEERRAFYRSETFAKIADSLGLDVQEMIDLADDGAACQLKINRASVRRYAGECSLAEARDQSFSLRG